MISLKTPLQKEDVLNLKVGDEVLISGIMFSARDRAHKLLLENYFEKIKNSVVYHCGPIVKNNRVISAGPTTSSRLNPYTKRLIEKYGIRVIIGKGGMDGSVLTALKGNAVYCSAIGGAGVLYAKTMKIKDVHYTELGMPEAVWEFRVKDFPVVVTMDSHGNSLYEEVYQSSKSFYVKLISEANSF